RPIEATAELPQPAAVRRTRLVKSPEEAARIAQNLRADKRIRVGTHLGAASPINGVGLPCLPYLRPSGVRIRRNALGLIRALLLVHSLGIGWRGEEDGETDSGNEQSAAEVCHLDRRHGCSPSCCGRRARIWGLWAAAASRVGSQIGVAERRPLSNRTCRAGERPTIADRYRACAP